MMCSSSQNHQAGFPAISNIGNCTIARYRPMVAASPLLTYRNGSVLRSLILRMMFFAARGPLCIAPCATLGTRFPSEYISA